MQQIERARSNDPISAPIRRVAVLGNYSPRACGIATFTTHLTEALADKYPGAEVDVIVVSDLPGYEYPERVKFEIDEQEIDGYRKAADFINQRGYDMLSVQHEFGIFGGLAGSHLLTLLREVKMPIVTTLHTVLKEPDEFQRKVMDELVQLSERMVVMSQTGADFLEEIYEVPRRRIELIHHGTPTFSDERRAALRKKLEFAGPTILTFGLLSPDKGIEFALEALPGVVKEFPNALYVVLGATHPKIKAGVAGESYREMLHERVRELGIEGNVRFVDSFVSQAKLIEFIQAADIYVTPYLNPRQITSGTLAYAVGAGKAVISTPYWYAQELLAHSRGQLVPFRDSKALSGALLQVLRNPQWAQGMRKRARDFGKQMRWPDVAGQYFDAFGRARRQSSGDLRSLVVGAEPLPVSKPTPAMNLAHLFAMTDDTGMIQHATYDIPNRMEGYCIDDNARALLLTSKLSTMSDPPSQIDALSKLYLAFVMHGFDERYGRFRNFMSYDRRWLEKVGSDDSHGRAMWSLGAAVANPTSPSIRAVAGDLFLASMKAIEKTTSPRAWAFAILGADEFLKGRPGTAQVIDFRSRLAIKLLRLYEDCGDVKWCWFETILAYDNARIPQALLVTGYATRDGRMVQAGLDALNWLMSLQQSPTGMFMPISCEGYRKTDRVRSIFDQQPLEAWSSMSACLTAAKITGDTSWSTYAQGAFNWFLGENLVGMPLYDQSTGGCRDGLHADSANQNQGAESTLSWLCALHEMQQFQLNATIPCQKADLL